MKAIIHTHYGPPEVLQLAVVPKPVPKAGEVLVKIHATTVNRTDCGFRSAEYFISRFFSGLFRPKFQVLGNEFAGEVVETGNSITRFRLGDRVFGYNDITFGAHAQYLVMPENGPLATIPENLSFEEAAPITEGAHYALCDIRAARVSSGQKVLVNGGTGAIGSAAVQLCAYLGAEVTAVCATPHLQLLRSLGAKTVIDYTQTDFTTIGERFDFVFDAVGKSTFGKCRKILKDKGIYISTELGPGGQNPFLALITPLFGSKKLLFPIPTISQQDVLFLKELVEKKQFKPLIDRSYPLEQMVEAAKYVETRQKIGNVVITVNHNPDEWQKQDA
ncbi:MAG: NAD(P)-dependent alcohol dehydrogenase [Prolixibacteraceae bacterium]|nr:NAD(P)-dependent alcohol dehydrogenase [Prolixibacteraceae bacterium]